MKRSRLLEILILLPLALGTTSCARSYLFRSEPGDASLYINDTLVGKTPIKVPLAELPPTPNLRIRVTKDGYQPFAAVVPGPSVTSLSNEIFIALNAGEDDTAKLNKNIARILTAQQLVMRQDYNEAMKLADEALAENPRYVYAQMLKASVLFLKKDYASSVREYEKVIEMDSANSEAMRMINYLRTSGATSRMPAGGITR